MILTGKSIEYLVVSVWWSDLTIDLSDDENGNNCKMQPLKHGEQRSVVRLIRGKTSVVFL